MPENPTIMSLDVSELEGRFVRLELMRPEHREDLRPAADDPRIWSHLPRDGAGDNYEAWFDEALHLHTSGVNIIYLVRLNSSGKLVGSLRYMEMVPAHARLEIGHAWYHPSAWGSQVNPECLLLLIGQAFEQLGARRVEFKTDERNERSQAAILKAGAKFEGIFRKHMVRSDGSARNSVYYAIIDEDWPAAKKILEARCYG